MENIQRVGDTISDMIAKYETELKRLETQNDELTNNIEELEYRIAERDMIIEKLQQKLDNYIINKTMTTTQKAEYIVNMVKSVGKSLSYAIDIIVWYSATDTEDKEIEKIIKQIW